MRDIFNDYKKQHSKKTFAIVTASFVFALSLNAFLFGTNTGARLQTSVLNAGGKVQTATNPDLTVITAGSGTDTLKIRTSAELQNVSKMYLSLAFDPEATEINPETIASLDKNVEVVKNSNVPGIISLTLLFNTPEKLTKNTEIISIVYKKKKNDKTVLNLAETQFKSIDGTIYELSNASIEF